METEIIDICSDDEPDDTVSSEKKSVSTTVPSRPATKRTGAQSTADTDNKTTDNKSNTEQTVERPVSQNSSDIDDHVLDSDASEDDLVGVTPRRKTPEKTPSGESGDKPSQESSHDSVSEDRQQTEVGGEEGEAMDTSEAVAHEAVPAGAVADETVADEAMNDEHSFDVTTPVELKGDDKNQPDDSLDICSQDTIPIFPDPKGTINFSDSACFYHNIHVHMYIFRISSG